MQNINPLADLDRHHNSVRVRGIPQGDFENTAATIPLNGFTSFGIPPNWISWSSSPSSFCAPFGKSWTFFFELPSQTTGRSRGVLKFSKFPLLQYIVNLLYFKPW
jgi:hypothetical protein